MGIGDTVKLKSGSPLMTVVDINFKTAPKRTTLTCKWFGIILVEDERIFDNLYEGEFTEESLKVITQNNKEKQ